MSLCLQIISYDSPRGGVSVITEKGETTTSFLLIQKARPSDSGRYQCNPSNAQSKSITVHVLNGKQSSPANVQLTTTNGKHADDVLLFYETAKFDPMGIKSK
jgi:hypothetical protein